MTFRFFCGKNCNGKESSIFLVIVTNGGKNGLVIVSATHMTQYIRDSEYEVPTVYFDSFNLSPLFSKPGVSCYLTISGAED